MSYGTSMEGLNAGRVVRIEDGSGLQEFSYGRLGELIKVKRYMPIPDGQDALSFETRWEYDSWNRVQTITYPDGEQIHYKYDAGGKLFSLISGQGPGAIVIIDTIRYDKFERRKYLKYGNQTRMEYDYDVDRGFLTDLYAYTANSELMQNLDYTYDLVGNILRLQNNTQPTQNGFGGQTDYQYTYDDLYRLTSAAGFFDNGSQFDMELLMSYTPAGKINTKTQTAVLLDAANNISNLDIDHSYSYNSGQTGTVNLINGNGYNHVFEWDANGNMVYHHDGGNSITQRLCWDEINRLIATSDGSQISHYIYDANGERAMKYNGTLSKQQINQYTLIDYALMDRYTYYPSPLLVFGSSGYSKHYFIEGQRVMSRIGDIWDAEAALIPLDTTPDGVDLNNKADQIEAQLETHLACLALEGEVDYHVDLEWLGWETEPIVFFYHPDHLGSSSFITDATGEPTQHLEYLPFGELFIEERSTWNTPYKFSGKELDDETGYSYFGARYYDPGISIWLSVDPLSDKYPNQTPFSYVGNRPIMVLDPDGRDEWGINGETGKISRVNENKHYLDQNGNRIIVKAGEVYQGNADLSTLTEVDLLSNAKGSSIDVSVGILGRQQTNEEEYQSFSFGSHAEAIDLYYFWAKSSNAEIAMCLTNTGGGHVGTDYSSENTRMTQLYESFFTSSLSLMSHSHSGSGGPPTYNVWTQNGKGGDLNNAFKSKYDYTREVYDVPNSLIYQYSRGTMIKADETRGAVTWDGKPRKAR